MGYVRNELQLCIGDWGSGFEHPTIRMQGERPYRLRNNLLMDERKEKI